jgi:small subunit ribosomal protein S6
MTIKDIRNYETIFVLRPDLEPNVLDEIVTKFTNVIKNNGGEIVNQEVWGMRSMAYPIGKHHTGYYVFTEFKCPGELIANLEREYGYDHERVIRHLTVHLDRHAAAWNEKRLGRLRAAKSAN